jgi:putative hydrolase of the HAD superfamily
VIRTIFFDAADTLFAPAEPIGETYARLARGHGVNVDVARLERGFHLAFSSAPALTFPPGTENLPARERAWWRRIVFEAFGHAATAVSAVRLEAVFETLFEHFARSDAWRVFADVRPTLQRLGDREIRLAVVSNFDSRLRNVLAGLGLSEAFHAIVLSSECGAAKPDAGIFAAALRATGAAPETALHVGDSEPLDVRGAEGAGIAALRIDRERRSGPRTIGSLCELLERLD